MDLTAVERGSKIVIQFTAPTLTTDGLVIKNAPYFELHVGDRKFPVPVTGALATREVDATPFYTQQVRIAVKVQNDRGRDAGWSNVVNLNVLPALPTPTALRAEATAKGVQVTWKSAERQFVVFRDGARIGTADARVYLDETAEPGKLYKYTVQATDGEVLSELTEAFEITPKDLFPPAVPTGLVAIVGASSVELVWDRNIEADLAGYKVYRDGRPIGESRNAPSYSDRTASKRQRYRYTVTSFDKLNNESAPSEPSEVAVP